MSSLGPIEVLFLLAPLLIVPLGLRAAGTRAPVLSWPAALSLLVSFFLRRGPVAAVLAGPWLLVSLALALQGLLRLYRRRGWSTAESVIDAGHLLLPVGGGWAVLSRWGATPLGFEEPLVLLTAVHFHYAAFASMVLTGLAGRLLGERPAYRVAAAGVVAGPLLLAAGITLSPLLEALAATLLFLALALLACLVLLRIVPRVNRSAQLLLVVSSLSSLAAMACAFAYGVREITGASPISLAQMARIHGPLNALGFALCGLLGFVRAAQLPSAAPVNVGRRQT